MRPSGMTREPTRVRVLPGRVRGPGGARNLLIAAICAVTLAACGSAAAPGSGHSAAAGGATAKPAKVSLDITVTGLPHGQSHHWTLRCEPAGGTHPDPAAACKVLLRAKNPFAPLPKGIMCPMIAAGTKTATVKGRWFGKPVHITMMQSGCYLPRWAKIGQIFN